jgi:RNA polymerase sigma-70 factor (ECF subfamily)
MDAPPGMDRATETALVAAAKGGDADAYGRLVAVCQRPLFAYALRLTADPHLAEDLCQEALLKGYRAIGGFSGGSALSTWLYRILHNTWLDHVRREGRSAPLADGAEDDGEDPPVLAREAVARFHDDTRGADLRERLEKALAAVSPVFREVVVLRDVQGHAYDEIAEITGTAVGTVKSRLARAREQLRALLSDPEAPGGAPAGAKSAAVKKG